MRVDLATIIGMAGGLGVVAYGIFLGGSFSAFVDFPSIVIVIGGCIAATVMRFTLSNLLTALGTGASIAFAAKAADPRDLIEEIAGIADVMRKQGPLGLENVEVDEDFLKKGLQLIADGYEPAFIRDALERERDLQLTRLQEGQRIFKSMGDAAPAFGMIGTLIGLVQMLGSMDDPKKIGPSMAVAILTTLYGAVIQNCVCIPISDKLGSRFDEEEVNRTLIIDGIMLIRESKSPAVVREALLSYLPHKHREELAEEAA
jgi:chemotaxis protein MotA